LPVGFRDAASQKPIEFGHADSGSDEYSIISSGTPFAPSIEFVGGCMRSERLGRAMPKTQPHCQVLAYEEIASRAYQHYLDRRSTDGYDIDDWLPAERELARERTDQQEPPLRRSGTPKPEAA